MTLHPLRIMIAVAKSLSVTKTAKDLHISQPAVSLQIKLLEEEYGAKLYEKHGRGIELTEAGRKYADNAENILSQFQNLHEEFNNNPSSTKAPALSVASTAGVSASFLLLSLSVFKETHPELQLFFQTDDSIILERLVLSSDLEIALITNPSYLSFLAYESYREESVVAVVAKIILWRSIRN